MTIPMRIALVDLTGEIDLQPIAGPLQEYLQNDVVSEWPEVAHVSVGAYSVSSVPPGCWSVQVQRKLDDPNALGYHTDKSNQPIAYVELTSDTGVTIAHETIEMGIDPWGNRLHAADLPAGLESSFAEFGLKTEHSYVRYLLEACDPCEATSYTVGGQKFSDWLRKSWYRTNPIGGQVTSFAGGCTAPRQVADGGYCSFENYSTHEWYQVFNENGSLQISELGQFNQKEFNSLREFTDHHARKHRLG